MFTETIETLNKQIEEAKTKLAELEAKKKAVMDMEARMNAVIQEVETISQELEVYPDVLVSFERSIRDTIRPHKPQKDKLQAFNSVGFINLKNSRNDKVKFFTNDDGSDIYCILIGMNDKRHAKKWESYLNSSFAMTSSLFSGSWNNEYRYTLGLVYPEESTIDDESILKLLEFDFLQAPPEQETHVKAPKQPQKPQKQPQQPQQPSPLPSKKSA
ncbi:hypothetical protein VKI21_02160 [Cyanobacterium aponinum UTEX 3222]|uniref:hypothetical protein n=1 Tax=Cyanobacterium aponinum TaxID=379064 RepID=UPI003086F36B|nr:hypothetical protein VKI21_02160 [Cyanobacterium aponinum UTEX 3222]